MQKTYVISGAGSGIGAAIAKTLAQQDEGTRIVLLGRNLERLEAVRASLPRTNSHLSVRADVRDGNSLRAQFVAIRLETLNLCGVIANAGVGGENHYGPEDRWDEILGTNLTGAYNLAREALPALMASNTPAKRILLISSVLARVGVAHYSAYCASKAGMLGLMRSLAVELAPQGILVNAICPGWTDTEMASRGINNVARAMGVSEAQARQTVLKGIPTRRMVEPAEIGSLVRYLCSDEQHSITGQSFDINGGEFMP